MKKIYYFIFLLLVLGCMKDDDIFFDITPVTAAELQIDELTGLKFARTSLRDNTQFNIKTDEAGIYSVEILDLTNSLVTRNSLVVKEGDNVYSVYTKILEPGDYTFRFVDINGDEKQKVKLFVE